ncbi:MULTISPECIES: hypothetical protein [unclassified Paracoccus (in: a-proteobacteria)]|uniref:hypothetical protein n=1 Tax=unclassified Paracoccus (in: a-proteobacteria) TaxID=2688777 RepID=UPI0012B37776|nr:MULTISPECIES: hypothetical protein [unclassified Paracoccus (in: a-proteobacteria)]UXU75045.1 hypothetical protein GB879_000675 [Paracoccus sp. SMMA_5]UXU80948.1 hypothetical protein GB880_000675 [Paracoccus sp. SMMA_5_TC]
MRWTTLLPVLLIGTLALPGHGRAWSFFDIFDLERLFGPLWGKMDMATSAPPPTSSPPPMTGTDGGLRASRIFAGPGQYPPQDFAAYGIVAFPGLATSADRPRHLMICEAYVANLPNADALDIPAAEQMVTVWPVAQDSLAQELTRTGGIAPCPAAVDGYNQMLGLRALRLAERAGARPGDRRGPFLLAWSPGRQHGQDGAHVLIADLSHVNTPDQAAAAFRRWARDIEGQPELWQRGWDMERLRLSLRNWADDLGARILPE